MADSRRALVLDSAIGTRLIDRGLKLDRESPALWVLDRPAVVAELHRDDVAAGAEVVLTSTFLATASRLGRFGRRREVALLNRSAVDLARGSGARVFGSVAGGASDLPEIVEQALLLDEAGCEAIVLETASADLASRFLKRIRPKTERRLVVSRFEPDGLNADEVRVLVDLGADAIGANCQTTLDAAEGDVDILLAHASTPIWIKPGGGLPGGRLIAPAEFEVAAERWYRAGVVYVGGCCGTDPRHVAAVRRARDSLFPETRVSSTDEHS